MKISLDSFVAVVRRSGLIEGSRLDSLLDEFRDKAPDRTEAQMFAAFLVRNKKLTAWQAEKLLHGKHKGFFLGKYKLLRLLGKGGMSSVYLAEHVLMRRRCAIKVLPAKRVNDASYLGRFHREAQAVAALDHPNIVRAYDVDSESDSRMEIHFLVMEYVEGKSLLEIILDDGPLRPIEAAEIMRQAAMGLHHAHNAGLVHRDIKPGNLLVDTHGIVKLLDLGLARFFDGEEESLTIQHDEKVLGTADYLAPEQAIDSHSVDARADIYSLGCTLYFSLTGHPPFTEGTLAQRLLAHQNREPNPVEAERDDVPPSLLAILGQMMAKDREDRYQSASALASNLHQWLDENGGEEWAALTEKIAQKSSDTAIKAGLRRSGTGSSLKGTSDSATRSDIPALSEDSGTSSAAVATGDAEDEDELGAFLSQLEAGKKTVERSNGGSSGSAVTFDSSAIQTGASESTTPFVEADHVPHASPASASPGSDARRSLSDIATESAIQRGSRTRPGDSRTRQGDSKVKGDRAVKTGGDSAVIEAEPVTDRFELLRQYRKPLIAVGSAAVVVLIALGVWSAVSSPSDPDEGEEGTATTTVPAETGGAADPAPPKNLGPEITVGPEGDFRTIGAALDYVRNNFHPAAGADARTIRIASGTYAERIVIDNSGLGTLFPENVQIVAADPANPPVLKPSGPEPVINVQAEGITLDGLTIDAEGKDVAVKIGGYLVRTKLNNLSLRGFVQTGIEAAGARGLRNARTELRQIRFEAGNPHAVGIRLTESNLPGPTAQILIEGCRFLGPLQSGLHFGDNVADVTIATSMFYNAQQAIRFAAGIDLQRVKIANNTFYGGHTAILFAGPPQQGSSGLGVFQNLFAATTGAEVTVEGTLPKGQSEALTSGSDGGRRYNWSDREAGKDDDPLKIFAADGHRGGPAVDFQSLSPGDAGFLKPRLAELGKTVKQPVDKRKFIGALPPG
ncbi:Serine/threonine-protein kinase PknB [Maioricimonas rarisocia]|uniref:non-specific serine/threonine protein kinase n=1 Tax=Maioricimonas rarisocia TaxID=2528026 RepID=A0A517Z6P8_9PLAN|nr:serine/threonine-protein kinase [Maioricimonas rarisocia]QDU38155.1 Serine/threonine-protein kinase PknB [Maioricimonas rarisocia]